MNGTPRGVSLLTGWSAIVPALLAAALVVCETRQFISTGAPDAGMRHAVVLADSVADVTSADLNPDAICCMTCGGTDGGGA